MGGLQADYDEAVWCKIVSANSKLTIGLIYRSPNINEEDNTKIQKFLIQDSFLPQQVLDPIRGDNVLDVVLSSQK